VADLVAAQHLMAALVRVAAVLVSLVQRFLAKEILAVKEVVLFLVITQCQVVAGGQARQARHLLAYRRVLAVLVYSLLLLARQRTTLVAVAALLTPVMVLLLLVQVAQVEVAQDLQVQALPPEQTEQQTQAVAVVALATMVLLVAEKVGMAALAL
jgi:hypothetical protein